jgi:hypothetical protein
MCPRELSWSRAWLGNSHFVRQILHRRWLPLRCQTKRAQSVLESQPRTRYQRTAWVPDVHIVPSGQGWRATLTKKGARAQRSSPARDRVFAFRGLSLRACSLRNQCLIHVYKHISTSCIHTSSYSGRILKFPRKGTRAFRKRQVEAVPVRPADLAEAADVTRRMETSGFRRHPAAGWRSTWNPSGRSFHLVAIRWMCGRVPCCME